MNSGDGITAATAAIALKFDLKGPGATQCPKCSLFLGSLPFFTYKDVKYHARCLTCCICSKKLETKDFREKALDFYCRKDYLKKFATDDDEDQDDAMETITLIIPAQENESPHTWQEMLFKTLIGWCGYCGDSLPLGAVGYVCSDCNYPVHKECKDQVPKNCKHDPKIQELNFKQPPFVSTVVNTGGTIGKVTKMATRPLSQVWAGNGQKNRDKDSPEEAKDEGKIEVNGDPEQEWPLLQRSTSNPNLMVEVGEAEFKDGTLGDGYSTVGRRAKTQKRRSLKNLAAMRASLRKSISEKKT